MNYESYIELRIKPQEGFEDVVKELYTDHGTFHDGDAGIDLYCIEDIVLPAKACGFKIPLGICVEAFKSGNNRRRPTGLFLLSRSSTGAHTPIRLSNHVGVIDATYRGPLMAICDNESYKSFSLEKGKRYFQLCAPSLKPMNVLLFDELTDTTRDKGGIGSTGK